MVQLEQIRQARKYRRQTQNDLEILDSGLSSIELIILGDSEEGVFEEGHIETISQELHIDGGATEVINFILDRGVVIANTGTDFLTNNEGCGGLENFLKRKLQETKSPKRNAQLAEQSTAILYGFYQDFKSFYEKVALSFISSTERLSSVLVNYTQSMLESTEEIEYDSMSINLEILTAGMNSLNRILTARPDSINVDTDTSKIFILAPYLDRLVGDILNPSEQLESIDKLLSDLDEQLQATPLSVDTKTVQEVASYLQKLTVCLRELEVANDIFFETFSFCEKLSEEIAEVGSDAYLTIKSNIETTSRNLREIYNTKYSDHIAKARAKLQESYETLHNYVNINVQRLLSPKYIIATSDDIDDAFVTLSNVRTVIHGLAKVREFLDIEAEYANREQKTALNKLYRKVRKVKDHRVKARYRFDELKEELEFQIDILRDKNAHPVERGVALEMLESTYQDLEKAQYLTHQIKHPSISNNFQIAAIPQNLVSDYNEVMRQYMPDKSGKFEPVLRLFRRFISLLPKTDTAKPS